MGSLSENELVQSWKQQVFLQCPWEADILATYNTCQQFSVYSNNSMESHRVRKMGPFNSVEGALTCPLAPPSPFYSAHCFHQLHYTLESPNWKSIDEEKVLHTGLYAHHLSLTGAQIWPISSLSLCQFLYSLSPKALFLDNNNTCPPKTPALRPTTHILLQIERPP